MPAQPHSVPSSDVRSREEIRFLHPGYVTPNNTLLHLPRVDRASTGDFGVHYGTALVACGIIANNAFETGRFALDRDGRQRVDLPFDGVLLGRAYYFFVGDGPNQYPVVPSFQDWLFPHDHIPDSWLQTPLSLGLSIRCSITNWSALTQRAHLVPKEESKWYSQNDMMRYGIDLQDIDNDANLLRLRPDVHQYFDKRWWAIVPKVVRAAETETHSPQYVAHILSRTAAELWSTYHDCLVQYLPSDSRPYLFARFAWAILLSVKGFITAGNPRNVMRTHVSVDGKVEQKAEVLTGAQLLSAYGGGGSKGATPFSNKRKSRDGTADEEDGSSSEDDDDGWDVVKGGRERRQLMSSATEFDETHVVDDLKTRFLQGLPSDTDISAS